MGRIGTQWQLVNGALCLEHANNNKEKEMKIMAAFLTLTLCAGCAGGVQKGGNRTTCKVVDPPPCVEPPIIDAPVMTFNKIALNAVPNNLCVPKDVDVEIRITPVNQSLPNSVFVFLKEPSAGDWLIGSNSDAANPDTIVIHVPATAQSRPYDFIIFDTGTGDCLDPRWEVD